MFVNSHLHELFAHFKPFFGGQSMECLVFIYFACFVFSIYLAASMFRTQSLQFLVAPMYPHRVVLCGVFYFYATSIAAVALNSAIH